MKYWIFDGSDVVGPLTPKEVAARPDFMAVSLICPEYASQKAASWRRASAFAEFHFDESSGKLQLVSAAEDEQRPAMPARRQIKKPSRPPRAMLNGFVKLSRDKRPAKVPVPVRLAKGEDLDLSLPKQEVTATGKKEQPAASITAPSPGEKQPSQQTQKLAYDATLMLEKSSGDLPPLPEGDGTRMFVTDADQNDDLPEKELFLAPQEEIAAETAPQPTQDESSSSPAADDEKQSLPEVETESISTLSQIKPRLLPTPEIEEFLTDQQLSIVRPHRNYTKKILIILLVLLLLPGIGYFTWKMINRPSAQPAAAVEAVGNEELALAMTEPAGTALAKGAAAPAPVTAAEKALAIVQNYRLSEDLGTIASYFDRIYQDRFAQGYTGAWSVEPLHKSTYIVKYRLTKTRTEPVVYVFQADAARGQLTGALNNAALDLVGKN